jgi:hypothetical protein
MGAVAWAIRQRSVSHPTGSPEAVARPRLPQVGSRTGAPAGRLTVPRFEAQESAFPIDDFIGESSSPAP